MPQVTDEFDAIAHVIELYTEGTATGDVSKLQEAFHKDARMFGSSGGNRIDVPIEEFFKRAQKRPAGTSYKARLLSVNQVNDAAIAILAIDGFWGSASFIDFFSFSRMNGVWKIVNKTFAHTGGQMPSM